MNQSESISFQTRFDLDSIRGSVNPTEMAHIFSCVLATLSGSDRQKAAYSQLRGELREGG
jgi:hypothetical protein